MNATNKFLDKCKAKLNVTSDYGLAKQLGISTSQISNYRNQKIQADDFVAVRMAEVLRLDPIRVIAAIHAEREKNEDKRAFWKKYSAAAATVTALLSPALAAGTLIQSKIVQGLGCLSIM
jgi:hypothetical protein